MRHSLGRIARGAFAALVFGGVASCAVIAGLKDRKLEEIATADSSPDGPPPTDGQAPDGHLDSGPQDGAPIDVGQAEVAPDDVGPGDSGPSDSGPTIRPICPTADGSSWSIAAGCGMDASSLRAVSGSGSSDVWAVGDDGTVMHWDGSVWQAIPLLGCNAAQDWHGISAIDAGSGWIVSADCIGLYSPAEDGGYVFTPAPAPTQAGSPLNCVWAAPGGSVVYAGGSSGIVPLNGPEPDSGWSPVAAVGGGSVAAISGTSANNVYALSADAVYHSISNGSWGAIGGMMGSNDGYVAIWATTAGLFVVGGTNDYDVPPNSSPDLGPSVAASLNAVWATGRNNVWAVGAGGAILQWDGGSAWTADPASGVETQSSLRAIWGLSDGSQIWAVGDNGIILHYP
jgi:hypothetical protein